MRRFSYLIGLFIVFIRITGYSQIKDLSEYKIGSSGFVENKGQIVDQNYKPNSAVKYLLSSPGFNVQLRQTGFSYDTYYDSVGMIHESSVPGSVVSQKLRNPKDKEQPQKFIRHYHRVDVELQGCNANTKLIAEEKSSTYFNYFTAGTPQGGVSDVHYYQKVTYKNIYPHIDLEFFTTNTGNDSFIGNTNFIGKDTPPPSGGGREGAVKYNFIIHPGANPADIKLTYKGANKVNLTDNKLQLNVSQGDFSESIPSSYIKDTKQPVQVNYIALGNNTYSFSTFNFQLSTFTSDLIIDPIPDLLWGTYYGGPNAHAVGFGIALDANDNVYITGATMNTSNIATVGAYKTTYTGESDAFIAKFNSTGSTLVWGTYYGGGGYNTAMGIALDGNNNVYITGNTSSISGIATAGAHQTINAGDTDVFVAKFNATGTSLLWGTYYGGTGQNWSYGIVLDANDNVYITGSTPSATNIATPGAYQTTNFGGDAFVAKFNPSGSTLLWGTYYGGTGGGSSASAIALDANDNVYITGGTASATNIATAGAYQTTNLGGNAFVAKFNPTGSSLLWGTYYGGSGATNSYAIALDASDNVYITGNTLSASNIATPGAFQTTYSTGYQDGFVAKLNSSGSSLLWGTYFGILGACQGLGIAVDAGNNVYITGSTADCANITTPEAYQVKDSSTIDEAFIAKFNPSGSCRLWGTYYGHGGDPPKSRAWGIALDANDNVYITGTTSNTLGIATPGAYQTSYVGNAVNDNYNAFAAKFDSTNTVSSIVTITGNDTVCKGTPLTLTASGGTTYKWEPGSLTGSSVTVSPLTNTTYTVVANFNGCAQDTTFTVRVNPPPSISINSYKTPVCFGFGDTLSLTGGNYTYIWSNGTTQSQYVLNNIKGDSTISVQVFNGTCYFDTALKVSVIKPPFVFIPTSNACKGECTLLTASTNGNSFIWSNGATTDTTTVCPDSLTTYKVTVSNQCPIKVEDSVTVQVYAHSLLACCDTIINRGDTIKLSTSKEVTYQWGPATGLNCEKCQFVNATPTVTTTYTVSGTDANGCTDIKEITVKVEVICTEIHVPNVFTPNGDGRNDELVIKTENLDTYLITIYDRWGKEMYKSTNSKQYWNGKTESGEKASDGVYYYIINATCQGNNYTKNGFVQLIR